MVKAKFKCNHVIDYGNQKQINFSAVYSDKGENADFTKYTPFGELKINVTEETAAYNYFKPGKHYYLHFEDADKISKQQYSKYKEVNSHDQVIKELNTCFWDKQANILYINVEHRGIMTYENWSGGENYF